MKEIVRRAEQIAGPGPLRPGVKHHISYHAVAQTKPNPDSTVCCSQPPGDGGVSSRPGDSRHPDRRGKEVPRRDHLPPAYRSLIDWYRTVYAAKGGCTPPDPILALRGLGRALWADEEADAYVSRLREGWS